MDANKIYPQNYTEPEAADTPKISFDNLKQMVRDRVSDKPVRKKKLCSEIEHDLIFEVVDGKPRSCHVSHKRIMRAINEVQAEWHPAPVEVVDP
jgi:hypothetical protein